jgi:hypothetical protein
MRIKLKRQDTLLTQRGSRSASHRWMRGDRTLDGEWVERSTPVLDTGIAPPKEPESPLGIKVPHITGSMPDFAIDAEFRLLVTTPMQVASEDMPTTDHNLARSINRKTGRAELHRSIRSQGHAPLLAQDSQLYLRHWRAYQQAFPLQHSRDVTCSQRIPSDMADGFSFG